MVDVMQKPFSARDEQLVEIAAYEAVERLPLPSDEQRFKLDPFYVGARDAMEPVARELGLAAPPAEPSAQLRERVLAAAIVMGKPPAGPRMEVLPSSASRLIKDGVDAVRSSEDDWIDAPVPGVAYKVLGRDDQRELTTRLVRFSRGMNYPEHKHGGVEEIYVLEGSVHVNGVILKAGDYCRSAKGTKESGTHSDSGAVAIVVSSDADEVNLIS